MHFNDQDVRPNMPTRHPGCMVAPGADARWRHADPPIATVDGQPVQVADTLALRDRQLALRFGLSYK